MALRQELLLVGVILSCLTAPPICAQTQQPLNILVGTQLASGFDIGINTSGGLTNWLKQEPPPPVPGDMKMVCPAGQSWCAAWVSDGPSLSTYPRPGVDVSMYQTLTVVISGDPGTTVAIGIKDATQPDNGSEAKVTIAVTSNWATHAIPLSSFVGVNLKNVYIPCEFVFTSGSQPQMLKVQSISYNGLASAGSMAQVASGGLWNTTMTLVNTGTASADLVLNFVGNDGKPLVLPIAFPQTPSTAPVSTSTVKNTLDAGAQFVVQTVGATDQTEVEGWVQVLSTGSLGGSAVFVWTPTGGAQEAVVPLETRNPMAFVLPFDYTGGHVTGVALANLSGQAVGIPVALCDDTGASLGMASTIQLAAYAHTSFMLAANYPAVADRRGTIEFDTPAGGQISALGIRAAPGGAITTVPVLAK